MPGYQTTRNNHFVPRGYLIRWSPDGHTVWEHKIVVPDSRYPKWKRVSLRSAGARTHLYDAYIPGLERDHFERWLEREIETPAYHALDRLDHSQALRPEDWQALIRFAVAQDARTPKAYDFHRAWEAGVIPPIMNQVIKSAVRKFGRHSPIQSQKRAGENPTDLRPVMKTSWTSDGHGTKVQLSLLGGSTSWMQRVKHLVAQITPEALRQTWHLLHPPENRSWPTSDHPLIRFRRRDGIVVYGPGWLRKGTEIFLPLSPSNALYAKVGSADPVPSIATASEAFALVRHVANNAQRSVYTDKPQYKWIEWAGRRYVDRDAYEREPW
jgi:hypothetical protein